MILVGRFCASGVPKIEESDHLGVVRLSAESKFAASLLLTNLIEAAKQSYSS